MVQIKNIAAVAVFALSSLVAAQTPPPACVLACVNEATSPHNFKEICETKVSDTWSCLKGACAGDAYDTASKHVQERCKVEGITVDMKKAVPATTTTKSSEKSKETGSSTKDEEKSDNKTEDKEEDVQDADSSAVRLGGSFGALAIALTVMGAMSF